MKRYPAIDVCTDCPDTLLAIVDDFGPTAVEERDESVRVFFGTAGDRDAAHRALAPRFEVTPIEVPDEDWARRSQEDLQPVTVGRITISPNPQSAIRSPSSSPRRWALAPGITPRPVCASWRCRRST